LARKLSDKEIVEGIRVQDDETLNYIYSHFFQIVRGHVLKNSGTEDDVPDIFQDAIIVLYQRITEDNINLTSDLKGYFYGIARNIWNVQLRHKRRTEELNIDLPEEKEEDVNDPIFQRLMNRAFNKLKPDCQAVIAMYYDGCSYEEIAVKMKLKNANYARRKKYLCKEALMELIKSDPEYKEYQRFLK
jgi:RNA polymerase sigma factor (sigma-70 family)